MRWCFILDKIIYSEIRSSWTAGASTTPAYKLAPYTYTGQYSYMDDPTTTGTTEGFGLMFYNARWYDPVIGRFAQADIVVPSDIQGLDRYAYVRNSPLIYIDPTGHLSENEICKGWGISKCNYDNILAELGEGLTKVLYNTDITWGDEIAFGDADGVEVVGTLLMLTYFQNDGTTTSNPAVLTNKGDLIIRGQTTWKDLMGSDRMAGYNEKNNKWSTWDKNNTSWGNDSAATDWAGQLKSHYNGEGLRLNDRWANYNIGYVTNRDPWWYVTTYGGLGTGIIGVFTANPYATAGGFVLWGIQYGADKGWWSGPTPPKEWISYPGVVYSAGWYAEQGLCGQYGITCP